MIKNGVISYSNALSPFLWWEPEQPALNALLIGLLTTFLSLQAISLVFDLLFGLKRSGQVILSDIHSLLLVWSFSPAAMRNAVLNQNCLTRRCHKCGFSKDAINEPSKTGIRKRVLAKLFILLLSGPAINIIAVAIVQESETTLTIRESGFGGLGWGLNNDSSVAESHDLTEACKQYNVSTAFQDEALVEFSSCNSPFLILSKESFLNEASISVAILNQSEVVIFTTMFGWEVWAITNPQLLVEESLFRVKHALTKETASVLVNRGMKLVAENCLDGDEQDAVEGGFLEFPNIEILLSKTIPCRSPLPVSEAEAVQKASNISGNLREYLTFVNAEKFELFVKDENTSKISAAAPTTVDNIPFLTRRQRNLSVALICVVSAIVFVLRILTTLLLNNDVSVAIELAVKKELGIRVSESLLRDGVGDIFCGKCSENKPVA